MLLPIILCEIGFWVILVAALAARYLLRMRRTADALLLGVPLVDAVLLVLIVIDLRAGAIADWTHGLGALYLGTSVVFGHGVIRWLDGKFARRYSDAPSPTEPALYGLEKARREWVEFAKAVLAGMISAAVLFACIVLVGDAGRTAELANWIPRIGMVLAIWALTPISYTLWPKRQPTTAERT